MNCEFLKEFMIAALVKIGVPRKDATICADVTLEASKRGIDSHGVERFKTFYYDRVLQGIQQAVTELRGQGEQMGMPKHVEAQMRSQQVVACFTLNDDSYW